MAFLSRLVWSEGMYLGPHHFQAQTRYFEDLLQFTTSALSYKAYGLLGYELDAEALRNGTVSVRHARGVFPDGLAFQTPEDAEIAPRPIRDLFLPGSESLTIYLGVPRRHAFSLVNGNLPRYLPEKKAIPDETTGRDQQDIELGRKNIRLITESEAASGWEALPLARILRDGAGHFVYDDEFIPPCLEIGASERLMMLCRTLLEIIEQKRSSVTPANNSLADPSPRELVVLWYLHALNSGAASLRHIWRTRRGHPEHLYLELSRLAGTLVTFALQSTPLDLPEYRHDDLQYSFSRLEDIIQTHLQLMFPTNCVEIPLSKTENYTWEGQIEDPRCFDRAQWIIALQSPVPDAELISNVVNRVKTCSKRFVGDLVRRALQGLILTHVQSPPAAVSRRVDYQYFSVSKAGPFWDDIVKTRAVGIYVPPGDLPNADVELFVVLDK